MKPIIAVIKKEYWIPYVELVLLIVFFGNYTPLVTLLQSYNMPVVEMTLWGLGLVLCIPLLYIAGKHDVRTDNYKLDEREVLHDAQVGDIAYHVSVFGLGAYLYFVHFDFILVGLLALVFIARLAKRYELENK